MKTSIKSILILLVCVFASQALAQTVKIGDVSGLPGQTVTVPVTFTEGGAGREVSTMALIMNYGGTYDSVSVAPACGGDVSADQITCAAAPGVLQAILINDLGVTGPLTSGTVANFDFVIPAAATPGVTDPITFDLVNTLVGTSVPLNPPAELLTGSIHVSEGPQPVWTSIPSSADQSPQFDFGSLDFGGVPSAPLFLSVQNNGEVGSLLSGNCYMGPPQSTNGAPQAVSGFMIVGDSTVTDLPADGSSAQIAVAFDPEFAPVGPNTGMLTCDHNGVLSVPSGGDGASGGLPEASPVSYDLAAHVMGFQVIDPFTATPTPDPAIVDGTATLAATGGASGNPVVFGSATQSVCTVSASTVTFLIGGTCTVTADQAGSPDYYPADQVTLDITVAKLPNTITGFDAPTAGVVDEDGALTAVADSTLPVAYASTTPAVCTVTGSTVSYLTAGNCMLTADEAGDDRYEAAAQEMLTIVVAKADQTITDLAATPAAGKVDTESVLSSTTSSGLDATYRTSTPAICWVSGTRVVYLAVGTCNIIAEQDGDANYNPATPVTLDVVVAKGDQVITDFYADPDGGGVDETSMLYATGGASTSPVVFSSLTTDICTVSGNIVTYVDTGTCTVAADQAADANYNAAPQVTLDLTVSDATSIPTLSQWGLISMFLIMLSLGGMVIRRRDMLK